MSKTVCAFDIGDSYIKVVVKGKKGMEVHAIQMPENLVKDGIIQMPHMLSDFLKEVKKECKLPNGECGIIVSDELTVCRTLTLPAMTEKQLEVNLPFEFSDYISGEPQKYVYDYALQEMYYDEDGKPTEMRLTGAVMSKESVTNYINIFKHAGLKLRTLIPQEIALTNVMKSAISSGKASKEKEYCIIALGHRTTQIYIYKGDELVVYRNLHIGGNAVDEAIAENENVDVFVARNYKNRNYNDVLEKEYVKDTFARIAVEVRKVINFYRFNNRDSLLEQVYFTGGGSNIAELCTTVADINDLQMQSMRELLPEKADADMDMSGIFALGVLLQ